MSNPALILKGHQLRIEAMKLLWRFEWLRPQELGLLIWPKSPSAATQGRNFARKIIDENLVIDRKLPLGYGTALVLSAKGAKLLNDNIQDGTAKTRKDFGTTLNGKFTPPATWIHDLNANTFLITLQKKHDGAKIWCEREIKRNYKNADFFGKIPDGMFSVNGKTCLLEGERTGKRGKELENMIAGSYNVFNGQCKNIFNKNPTDVVFLVLSDLHIASILRKFVEFKNNNVTEGDDTKKHFLTYKITFAIPIFEGFAVRDFEIERYCINGPTMHHELYDVKWLKEKIKLLRKQNTLPVGHSPFFRFPNAKL